jgi:flagellar hook-length control protein FliK
MSAVHGGASQSSSSPGAPSGATTVTGGSVSSGPPSASVAPATAGTPITQAAPATPVAPPAAAPATSPPTPAQQVVTVLAPLRSSDDGTHEVTIGLEPEGLGTVKATVTVSPGQIVVQLGTDNDQARDALRQALPLLKHELGGDGSSASVLLSNGDHPGAKTNGRPPSMSETGSDDGGDAVDDAMTAAPVSTAPGHGHIDLHL